MDANNVANQETLTAIDVVAGGDGTDTLKYVTVGGTALPAARITGIEVIDIVSDGAVTADVQTIAGLATLTAYGASADVNIDTKANVTSITVEGSGLLDIAIDDNGTTATLTSVSIKGVSDDGGNAADEIDINSKVLTSLSLTDITQVDDTDDISSDATGTLTINLNNVSIGASDIIAASATGAVVNTAGTKDIVIDDLDLGAAKTVTINANTTGGSTIETTIDGLDIAEATTLVIGGTGNLVLTAGTYTKLTSFDASGASGNITLTAALATDDGYTGGSGKDTLASVGATTKGLTLGAGDDKVTLTVANLGTKGTIDGGDGTDTLAMTSAHAVTASGDLVGTTRLETKISNFEKLEIAAAAVNVAASYDLAAFDDINYVVYNGTADDANANIQTIDNFKSGGTLHYKAFADATDSTVAIIAGAAVSETDVLNAIKFTIKNGILKSN